MPDYELEKAAVSRGFKLICGVDEAGKGPLAGPVCAAAVILPTQKSIFRKLTIFKSCRKRKGKRLFDAL